MRQYIPLGLRGKGSAVLPETFAADRRQVGVAEATPGCCEMRDPSDYKCFGESLSSKPISGLAAAGVGFTAPFRTICLALSSLP